MTRRLEATPRPAARVFFSTGLALALALCLGLYGRDVSALDLGTLGGAANTVQQASGAVSAGQQAVDAGRSATNTGMSLWERSQQQRQNTSPAPMSQVPRGPAPLANDEGGPRRIVAVLGDMWAGSARRGEVAVALLDQGPYFVQRQAAHVAAPGAQWLAATRGDSTGATIELPREPEGTTYDLSTGRVRPGGRGVRIFALSVHADLPRRSNRISLDAIEQHFMLRASSVRTEWPSQPGDILEATGGKLLVWASDSSQRFPSGLGADGRLFTADDPMVTLPNGYTVVTLDALGFRFDRGREIALTFHAVSPAADIDLSRIDAPEAVTSLIGLLAERYPYPISPTFDVRALQTELARRAQVAMQQRDSQAYAQVLTDVGIRLRDSQYRVLTSDGQPASFHVDRGLSPRQDARGGVAVAVPRVAQLDDGRLFVADVAPGSTAAQAGLTAGAEIRKIDGESPQHYLELATAFSARSTEAGRRAEALSFDQTKAAPLSLRVFQLGQEQSLMLGGVSTAEPMAPAPALAAFELRTARGGRYGYIAVNSFADGTGQLDRWERSLALAMQQRLAGLVVDLRGHHGNSHQLLAHMLASLYSPDKPLFLRDAWQRVFDPGARVWRVRGSLGIPPQLPLAGGATAYTAPLTVITGSDCAGPCELFSSWLQHSQRADIVSTQPTAGAVGHLVRVQMPGGLSVLLPLVSESGPGAADTTTAQTVGLQGRGTAPRTRVPVDSAFIASLQSGGDPILDSAVLSLDRRNAAGIEGNRSFWTNAPKTAKPQQDRSLPQEIR